MEENFNNLSLYEKRNELNKEILSLVYLINKIVDDSKTEYFNYDVNNTLMTEDEFLYQEYLQIKEVKDKLINIFK